MEVELMGEKVAKDKREKDPVVRVRNKSDEPVTIKYDGKEWTFAPGEVGGLRKRVVDYWLGNFVEEKNEEDKIYNNRERIRVQDQWGKGAWEPVKIVPEGRKKAEVIKNQVTGEPKIQRAPFDKWYRRYVPLERVPEPVEETEATGGEGTGE